MKCEEVLENTEKYLLDKEDNLVEIMINYIKYTAILVILILMD
mgnify:CR=1 FL=1